MSIRSPSRRRSPRSEDQLVRRSGSVGSSTGPRRLNESPQRSRVPLCNNIESLFSPTDYSLSPTSKAWLYLDYFEELFYLIEGRLRSQVLVRRGESSRSAIMLPREDERGVAIIVTRWLRRSSSPVLVDGQFCQVLAITVDFPSWHREGLLVEYAGFCDIHVQNSRHISLMRTTDPPHTSTQAVYLYQSCEWGQLQPQVQTHFTSYVRAIHLGQARIFRILPVRHFEGDALPTLDSHEQGLYVVVILHANIWRDRHASSTSLSLRGVGPPESDYNADESERSGYSSSESSINDQEIPTSMQSSVAELNRALGHHSLERAPRSESAHDARFWGAYPSSASSPRETSPASYSSMMRGATPEIYTDNPTVLDLTRHRQNESSRQRHRRLRWMAHNQFEAAMNDGGDQGGALKDL